MRFTTLAFLAPALSWGLSPSLDIGTFTIDNYSGNGGGATNLTYQIAGGQNFYAAAMNYIPPYSAAVGASAGGSTNNPTLNIDYRNTQVTKAALINTSSGFGNREYCDFAYYGGHGLVGGMYLGASPGYGAVAAGDLNLGVGYTRWMIGNGCSLFYSGTPSALWAPAFKGIKVLLGFRSLMFDNNLSLNLYNDFFNGWTYGEKTLYNAFFDAQADWGYQHLYPTKGLEPGCLSAQVTQGRYDYCRDSFRWVAHDYTPAIQNSGYFYSRVIGTPQY